MAPKASPKPGAGGKKKAKAPEQGTGVGASQPSGEEKKQLQAELGVAVAAVQANKTAARDLDAQLAALRLQHNTAAADAADVLASQQREVQGLRDAAHQLEQALEAAWAEAAALKQAAQHDAEADATGAARGPMSQQDMLSMQQSQEAQLAAQQQEVAALRSRLQAAEARLAASATTTAALQVQAASRSELRFMRSTPWLVHVCRQHTTGAAPGALQAGGALAAAGRRLVLELGAAAVPAGAGGRGAQGTHILDLPTRTWSAAACAEAVVGRAFCSAGSQVLGFGGRCRGELLAGDAATQLFAPDLQQWLPAPAPADASAPQPPPRVSGALAYCPRANAAYLYGGQGQNGTCLGDLWRYDLARACWSRLLASSAGRPAAERACTHEAPPPCRGGALAVSQDGSRLWLMGGCLDSGRCSSSLHWWDTEQHYWAAAEVKEDGGGIQPRMGHAMACIDRFVVVCGGQSTTAARQVAHRQDTLLFDPADGSWEQLDSTAWELSSTESISPETGARVCVAGVEQRRRIGVGAVSKWGGEAAPQAPFLGANSAAFVGSRLLLLKAAGPEGGPSVQLWSVDLQVPEVVQRLAAAKTAATASVPHLMLTCEAVTATSAQLSWRAPAANADKLLSFKLMMTNAEGRAREAYEGPQTSCDVTGLLPRSELVFCVKAQYDDASFLWSEPLMVTTGRKEAGQKCGQGRW